MNEQEMLPGRPYRFKLCTAVATATITKPKYQIDVDNIAHVAADTLALNAIGVCTCHWISQISIWMRTPATSISAASS